MRKVIPYRSNPMLGFCFRLLYSSAINANAVEVCYSRKSSNGAKSKKAARLSKTLGSHTVLSSASPHCYYQQLLIRELHLSGER